MKPLLCCLILGSLGFYRLAKPTKPKKVPPEYRQYVKYYSDTATYTAYLEMLARENFCSTADTNDILPANALDKNAEFPGGEEAMIIFIKKTVKLPLLAMELNKPGRVLLNFLIDEQGRICNVRFMEFGGYKMDEEALRVLLAMGKWTPAFKDRMAVKSYYTLPIRFNFIIQD